MDSEKQNKCPNKTETNSQIQRTNWWSPDGRGLVGWVKRAQGTTKHKFPVIQTVPGRESTAWGRKTVSNIRTTYGVGWVPDLLG